MRVRHDKVLQKSLGTRIIELINALLVIRDSLHAIGLGERHQLIPLAGQLRALLTDKSAKPLFLDLAVAMGRPLNVFARSGIDSQTPLTDGEVFFHTDLMISPRRRSCAQEAKDLASCLRLRMLRFEGQEHSMEDVINVLANKAGGAHYSTTIPEHFVRSASFNVAGQGPYPYALVGFAEAVYQCGVDFLRELFEFEVFTLLSILTPRPATVMSVMDYRSVHSSARMGVAVDQEQKPVFSLVGFDGSAVQMKSEDLVDWRRPRLLHLSHRIDGGLGSVLEMRIDDELWAGTRLPRPSPIAPSLDSGELHLNMDEAGRAQDLSFACSDTLVVGAEVCPLDRARMLLYVTDNFDDGNGACTLFKEGGSGIMSANGSTLTGPAALTTWSEALRGDGGAVGVGLTPCLSKDDAP